MEDNDTDTNTNINTNYNKSNNDDTINDPNNDDNNKSSNNSNNNNKMKKNDAVWPFGHMIKMPLPYLLIIPIVLILLIIFGWTQDDIVETQVGNIWVPQSGDFYKDRQYQESLGVGGASTSSIAAMAISRDGNNIMTDERLNEIRTRMEISESVTIEHKGMTYTWDDVCAANNVGPGTTYESPCVRLTPMDLFQEARWVYDVNERVTWRSDVIYSSLVTPIIPRFGIMNAFCLQECGEQIIIRTNPNAAVQAGYDASYANPLGLFEDIATFENNHPCKSCIETNFEEQIDILTAGTVGSFAILAASCQALLQSGAITDPNVIADLSIRAEQYGELATTISRTEMEQFFGYYTTRQAYSDLNVQSYINGYSALIDAFLPSCLALQQTSNPSLICPNATITLQQASIDLINHADSPFSSLNTAGLAFPWWSSEEEGEEPILFEGTFPIGGSGVNLSGELFSLFGYVDVSNAQTENWNPLFLSNGGSFPATTNDPLWILLVESNPIYKWFLSSYDIVTTGDMCGNNPIPGTQTNNNEYDAATAAVMAGSSLAWCTKFNVPNEEQPGDIGTYSRQHFAIMWYDLVIDALLGLVQGQDDPYSWTTGQGCGYSLAGERNQYTNKNESEILVGASGQLYYIDEGVSVGPIDRNLLLGGTEPSVADYSPENPLTTVSLIQTLYIAAIPENIVERVKNCNRPGGPINITEDDAEDILFKFKEEFEEAWTEGWDDDNDGEVQFVFFADDNGADGTTARVLKDITLANGTLTSISICLIVLFSIVLLISPDWIESRVLITLLGIVLVVLAYFASLGLAILMGVKLNVAIAWTLPFIVIGIGVDDVYIVLFSLKKQGGFSVEHFLRGMREVAIPVTMTSMVNGLMFAVMNVSDIPAIYLTANVAVISVISLYLSVLFCYPAYCWLDFKRQAAGYKDVLFCLKARDIEPNAKYEQKEDQRQVWIYEKIYLPAVLGTPFARMISHTFLFASTLALLATGIYGITQYEVGLGLEDFFPHGTQAQLWAETRTSELASWAIAMNWGAINYTDPMTQQKMIKQFEGVVANNKVSQVDTKQLWISDLLIWSTRHCTSNFDRPDPNTRICGMNVVYPDDGTPCEGGWMKNTIGLRDKIITDGRGACEPYEEGHCRPASEMFLEDLESAGHNFETDSNSTSYCPFVEWSDDKFLWCMTQWRNLTDYGGRFVLDSDGTPSSCTGETYNDEKIRWPIPFSASPGMFSFGLFSHDLTLDLVEETWDICDNDDELHCWMEGIPYNYWSQYLTVFEVLVELSLVSISVGFVVAWIFLFGKIYFEKRYSFSKVFFGTLGAAGLIGFTILISLLTVVGLSVLAGVNLTGFSNMSFVLSVAFSVEFAVHIVSRWLRAPTNIESSLERVRYTMSFLALPTFMAWISSTIGVVCLAFTEFSFTQVFFFRPLIIVMMVTYFIGCFSLPALLCYVKSDLFALGKNNEETQAKDPVLDENNFSKAGADVLQDEPEDPRKEEPVNPEGATGEVDSELVSQKNPEEPGQ